MVKLLFSCFFFLLFWLLQLWKNSYNKIILCVQQKNYSYSTNYLYIQRNNYFHSINYLHIQLKIMFIPQIISIFNKISFSISWFFLCSTKNLFVFNELFISYLTKDFYSANYELIIIYIFNESESLFPV